MTPQTTASQHTRIRAQINRVAEEIEALQRLLSQLPTPEKTGRYGKLYANTIGPIRTLFDFKQHTVERLNSFLGQKALAEKFGVSKRSVEECVRATSSYRALCK